jgi:hypothetical protein
MPKDLFSKERYKICLSFIRASARNFAHKFRSSHIDYWDFFSEGILTFTLCVQKWEKKGKDFDDSEFEHYFRQALSNNNKDLLGKVFAKKRRGYFKPKNKPCFGNFGGNDHCELCDKRGSCQNFVYKCDLPLSQALHIKSDGGFDDVYYQELVEYVKGQLLSSVERYIFMLLVDPPKDLCELAIRENRKKMRSIFFNKGVKSKGPNSVRPTGQLIIKYLCERGCPITQNEYYAYQKRIRGKVLEVIKEGSCR